MRRAHQVITVVLLAIGIALIGRGILIMLGGDFWPSLQLLGGVTLTVYAALRLRYVLSSSRYDPAGPPKSSPSARGRPRGTA